MRKNRQLLLARDRLGQKPLVYRYEAGRLLFASELKSLLEGRGRTALTFRIRPIGRIPYLSVHSASEDDLSRN